MAKAVIFVIGVDREVGFVTVKALSSTFGGKIDIKAGVGKPDSATKLNCFEGVTVVAAYMSQKEKLRETFNGVSTLFLVCPVSEDRAQLTIDTAEVAKEAGVKHLLVLSDSNAGHTDTTFGKQFNEIERAVSSLGVPCTFLRITLFMDNYFFFRATIKDQSVFYCPVEPCMPYTPVAGDDVGLAAAVILESPEKHTGKTYTIVSDRHTFRDVAEAFTKELGREVKYIREPYEDFKEYYIQNGFPDWQAEGIMQLYRLVDAGSGIVNREDIDDFSEITGKKPTSLSAWVMKNAAQFK